MLGSLVFFILMILGALSLVASIIKSMRREDRSNVTRDEEGIPDE